MAAPRFFAIPQEFGAWLAEHHAAESELLVGLWKRGSGKSSMTWPESVDEALCYGWIDGVRKSIDAESYTIRFTPRRPRSIWSAVNIVHVAELIAKGRMQPAGLVAFEKRSEARSGIYSYEQRTSSVLSPSDEGAFRANQPAWEFFKTQAPWYQRAAIGWVVSAKREETRAKRLGRLIGESGHGRRLDQLTPNRPSRGALKWRGLRTEAARSFADPRRGLTRPLRRTPSEKLTASSAPRSASADGEGGCRRVSGSR